MRTATKNPSRSGWQSPNTSLSFLLLFTAFPMVASFGLSQKIPSQMIRRLTPPLSEVVETANGDSLDLDTTAEAEDDLLSKRVPVAVRYSADSGMKPYFLTMAKKIKELHPDVILDKVILPKLEVKESDKNDSPTFEVLVDGKIVVPTLGRKDRDAMGIFVSMQELDMAISRARRRRRPSTVYGEEGSNVQLEILRTKAAASGSEKAHKRPSHRHSND